MFFTQVYCIPSYENPDKNNHFSPNRNKLQFRQRKSSLFIQHYLVKRTLSFCECKFSRLHFKQFQQRKTFKNAKKIKKKIGKKKLRKLNLCIFHSSLFITRSKLKLQFYRFNLFQTFFAKDSGIPRCEKCFHFQFSHYFLHFNIFEVEIGNSEKHANFLLYEWLAPKALSFVSLFQEKFTV